MDESVVPSEGMSRIRDERCGAEPTTAKSQSSAGVPFDDSWTERTDDGRVE
jgi:hypothetical protein